MNFMSSEDQIAYRDSVATMLAAEVTAESIRARWDSPKGIDEKLIEQLNELGLNTMLVPESCGGLGLSEQDFILLAQECGRAALPEPLVDNVLVANAMLADVACSDLVSAKQCEDLLSEVAAGKVMLACGHWINPFINMADIHQWLLLSQGDEVHLVESSAVELLPQRSADPSRRIFKVNWQPKAETRIANGEAGAGLWRRALNRGALGVAAQLIGLSESILYRAVGFTADREQFGRPVGSNQAVKHLLADCAVSLEFAKPVMARAAYTVGSNSSDADYAVSHAKVAASRAAQLCARHGMQVHGAMGYTWECDLHIWMKRCWAIDKTWGDAGFHKNRIQERLLDPSTLMGAEHTFTSATSKTYNSQEGEA